MAGFLPTMESNLGIAMGVDINVNCSIIAHICKPLAKMFTDHWERSVLLENENITFA